MIEYTSDPTATFTGTIEQPQDVIDDVVVGTVNPATSILMDNTSALYQAAAMRCVGSVDDVVVSATLVESGTVGWGRRVGPIVIDNQTTILAAGTGVASQVDLATLSVTETGTWAFAQNSSGDVIVGTGGASGQKIWVSVDGGLSWTQSNYPSPGASSSSYRVLVFWDRYSGNWYIMRHHLAASGEVLIFRSINNGTSWTYQGTIAATSSGTNAVMASSPDGTLWLLRVTGSTGTLRSSSNFGATWTTVATSNNIRSVVEHDGEILVAGYKTGPLPYLAVRQSGSWTEIPVSGPPGSAAPLAFTRYLVTVGPLLVAAMAKGTGSSENYYLTASADGGYSWRYFYRGLNTTTELLWQARSPGGIHVVSPGTTNTLTLSPLEMW